MINSLVWGENTYAQPFSYVDRNYIDCQTSDMLIASMMKLSLNSWQRKDMVRKGLLKWLVNHLEDVECSASAYHLEYGTALLMMLLTYQYSPEFILDKSRQLLALFARFLNNDVNTCWPYIRAALMALFRNHKIVNNARSMNFDEILRTLLKQTNNANEIIELESLIICLNSTKNVHFENIESCVVNLAEDKTYLDKEIDTDDTFIVADGLDDEIYLERKFGLKQKTITEIKNPNLPRHFRRDELVLDETIIPKSYNEAIHTFDEIPTKTSIFSKAPIITRRLYKRFPSYSKLTSKNSESNGSGGGKTSSGFPTNRVTSKNSFRSKSSKSSFKTARSKRREHNTKTVEVNKDFMTNSDERESSPKRDEKNCIKLETSSGKSNTKLRCCFPMTKNQKDGFSSVMEIFTKRNQQPSQSSSSSSTTNSTMFTVQNDSNSNIRIGTKYEKNGTISAFVTQYV